jgi:hypothetical protein
MPGHPDVPQPAGFDAERDGAERPGQAVGEATNVGGDLAGKELRQEHGGRAQGESTSRGTSVGPVAVLTMLHRPDPMQAVRQDQQRAST